MKKINRQGIEFLVHDDANNEIANFWTIDSWEYGNYAIIKNFSGICSTFVNAGGWIGPFTLFAAKLFSKVYTLEPDPLAYDELNRNIQLNGFTNITADNKAFFDGSIPSITIGSDYSPLGRSGTSMFQKDKSIEVLCITLREFFQSNKIPAKSFFLLDVEGAEYALFDDFEFFKEYKPIMLVELHTKFFNDENLNRLVKSLTKLREIYNIPNINLDRQNITHQLFQPL